MWCNVKSLLFSQIRASGLNKRCPNAGQTMGGTSHLSITALLLHKDDWGSVLTELTFLWLFEHITPPTVLGPMVSHHTEHMSLLCSFCIIYDTS